MYHYLENTKLVEHSLTEEQIASLRSKLDEIDHECFDMSGRARTEHGTFLGLCFEAAIEAELSTGVKAFLAYRYFRSMVLGFKESAVQDEYRCMIMAFKVGAKTALTS